MKKIAKLREQRENRFWENRMKLARVQKSKDIIGIVEKNPDLISTKEIREQVIENKNLKVKKEESEVKKGRLEIVEM